jgi:ribosomal protein S18 acetylase RimI-like enzyme
MSQISINRVSPEELPQVVPGLAHLLAACVEDGASVSFVQPFTYAQALAFWNDKVGPSVRVGNRTLFVAWAGEAVAGSVQLDLDMPPNQQHRAEVSKLLVHPAHRRQGIAQMLMAVLEQEALAKDRSLITLDTRTGDKAEPLYTRLGYRAAGVIPGYARDPRVDRFDATTYMYKTL